MNKPLLLLETVDAAKALGLSVYGVRGLLDRGELQAYAVSPRGCRYFTPEEVELVRQAREAAQAAKAAAPAPDPATRRNAANRKTYADLRAAGSCVTCAERPSLLSTGAGKSPKCRECWAAARDYNRNYAQLRKKLAANGQQPPAAPAYDGGKDAPQKLPAWIERGRERYATARRNTRN